MKRHIFGIIFIATTAVSCDALRCFQCEMRSSLDFRVDTCIGQNATTCPEEAKFCISNTSSSIASTSDILGCHIGNNTIQYCVFADDAVHCSVFCDTDGCNSPFPTDGEFLSPGPDIAPPIPAIPPSLLPVLPPPAIGPDISIVPSFQPPSSPDTGDIFPPQAPPEVEIPPELATPPQPPPGVEPDNLGELSCFQCTILNVGTLPFPLDECAGASPRRCSAREDNYCVIVTSTEPGFRSVIRACVANISITSCTSVGQGRVCAEYCSTDGCNSLEGIIQEATTVSDPGMQGGEGGGEGGGGAARNVQVHHIVLLSVIFALLCLS